MPRSLHFLDHDDIYTSLKCREFKLAHVFYHGIRKKLLIKLFLVRTHYKTVNQIISPDFSKSDPPTFGTFTEKRKKKKAKYILANHNLFLICCLTSYYRS